MWGGIVTEVSFMSNFHIGFNNTKSDILLHLAQWQYWWWFWFSYFWVLYFLLFMRIFRYRVLKFKPRLATTYRPHGKWGDLIVCLLPVSWCANIITNSNFILRMIEWQSESSLFTLRVRGKQWYWVYKYDLKSVTDVLTAPKNIGNSKWVISSPFDLQIADDYLHIHQLRAQSNWVKNYWDAYAETDINNLTLSRETSAFLSGIDFYKNYVKADTDKRLIQIMNPTPYLFNLDHFFEKFNKKLITPTHITFTNESLNDENLMKLEYKIPFEEIRINYQLSDLLHLGLSQENWSRLFLPAFIKNLENEPVNITPNNSLFINNTDPSNNQIDPLNLYNTRFLKDKLVVVSQSVRDFCQDLIDAYEMVSIYTPISHKAIQFMSDNNPFLKEAYSFYSELSEAEALLTKYITYTPADFESYADNLDNYVNDNPNTLYLEGFGSTNEPNYLSNFPRYLVEAYTHVTPKEFYESDLKLIQSPILLNLTNILDKDQFETILTLVFRKLSTLDSITNAIFDHYLSIHFCETCTPTTFTWKPEYHTIEFISQYFFSILNHPSQENIIELLDKSSNVDSLVDFYTQDKDSFNAYANTTFMWAKNLDIFFKKLAFSWEVKQRLESIKDWNNMLTKFPIHLQNEFINFYEDLNTQTLLTLNKMGFSNEELLNYSLKEIDSIILSARVSMETKKDIVNWKNQGFSKSEILQKNKEAYDQWDLLDKQLSQSNLINYISQPHDILFTHWHSPRYMFWAYSDPKYLTPIYKSIVVDNLLKLFTKFSTENADSINQMHAAGYTRFKNYLTDAITSSYTPEMEEFRQTREKYEIEGLKTIVADYDFFHNTCDDFSVPSSSIKSVYPQYDWTVNKALTPQATHSFFPDDLTKFKFANFHIDGEDLDNDYTYAVDPAEYIDAKVLIQTYLTQPLPSSSGMVFGHSEATETAFNAQKGQSIHQPVRLIKFPLNFIKDHVNDEVIELFRLRFSDGMQTAEQKANAHQTYLIFKQKRYKRVGSVKTKFRYYVDWQGKPTERLHTTYQPYVDKNRLVRADRTSHMTHYDIIKTSHRRSENIALPFNKRLLRTRRIVVLPAHVNIAVITNSFDVVHSWFIPGLGVKLDCIPGRSTHHTLHIDNVGFYYGQCAEICGRYHHHMPIRICALPFEHFMVWWHSFAMPRMLKAYEEPLVNARKDKYFYSNKKYVW